MNKTVRILIVEDQEAANEGFRDLFKDEFEKCTIDSATSVKGATRLIDSAHNKHRPYDVVVLDFHLPEDEATTAISSDESVCQQVRDLMPEALVVHVTGFAGDPTITEHMGRFHVNAEQCGGLRHSGLFFCKHDNDNEWAVEMSKKTKGYVLGRGIETKLADLLEQAGHANHSTGRILDYHLAALCQQIEECWNDLEPGVQRYIETKLSVHKDGASVHVSWA